MSNKQLVIAVLAATVALAACTKEISTEETNVVPASQSQASGGSRVIAVSFGPQTKTRLEDGLQPKFVDKDSILISNGEALDTCAVEGSGDNATISTDLTGQLTAVYPYRAASFNKKDPSKIGGVVVSSSQSGKFADANICKAEMESPNEQSLTFNNKTAVLRFYVDESIQVKSIKITSVDPTPISDDNDNPYEIIVTTNKNQLYDAMPSEGQDKRICYVAVKPTHPYSTDLRFEIETGTQSKVEKELSAVTLRAHTMYNVFIPYYVNVNVGTDLEPIYQKWAYCNIGAFLPEEPGDYFSWAEVAGHSPAEKVFSFPESNPDEFRYTGGWAASSGFAECNTPYYDYENSSYKRYNALDELTGLESGDDAASVNWGDGWKMPTDTALQVLAGAQRKWDGSKKGYFFGTESNSVFFPVTGYGEGNELKNGAQFGAYWSSVLSSEAIGGKDKAVYLLLKKPNSNAIVPDTFDIVGAGATADTDIYTTSAERYYGLPIRPIYDPAPEVVATDLSSSGTANCYIVSAAGVYKFNAGVKGNSSESVGTPESVEVLWESFGTSTAPSVEDLVKNVSLENGYVKFTATDKKGNAVIAVKDENEDILWSWHIWLTDKPEDQVYANNAGTMMDRNLGVTSNNGSDAANKLASYGLLYQWGRKDPFLGADGISSNTQAASTISSWPSNVSAPQTVDWTVQNPTIFITNPSSPYDWTSPQNNELWRPAKTIYDPCPSGYRVPDGGNSGVWTTANFSNETKGTFGHGYNFSVLTSGTTWYPAAGYGYYQDRDFHQVGSYGSYWSCTPNGTYAYTLDFNSGSVSPAYANGYHTYGLFVRCQKIVEE